MTEVPPAPADHDSEVKSYPKDVEEGEKNFPPFDRRRGSIFERLKHGDIIIG
jgi:hypothetical protein